MDRDVQLVIYRRGSDGAEEHVIPLDASALQQLLLDMDASA